MEDISTIRAILALIVSFGVVWCTSSLLVDEHVAKKHLGSVAFFFVTGACFTMIVWLRVFNIPLS